MMKRPLSIAVLFGRAITVLLSLFLLILPWLGCKTIPSPDANQTAEGVRQRKESAVTRMEESPRAVQPDTALSGPSAGPEILTGPAPQWASISPGSDDQYHYGVGRADLSGEDYGNLARERALADMAAKIVVTVRKETIDYAGFSRKGRKTISEQKVEETVKTSTDARLQDPQVVARYQDKKSFHILMRVSALTPLQREMKSWRAQMHVPTFTVGPFLDSRGIRTGFGDYLKDLILSTRAFGADAGTNDPAGASGVPVVSGRYVLLSDSISVTVKIDYSDGRGPGQKTFRIPAEPDHIAMMANRRDHSLVNAVPGQTWGGGRLSLGGEVFGEGDEIVIRFTPVEDCYVNIFNIVEDGTVTMLLPNRFRNDNFIKAGASLTFPGSLEREKGLIIRAHLPRSKVATRESVKVVGTQRPVSMTSSDFTEAVVEGYEPDSEGIRRLLATLEDLDNRGVAWFEEVQYFVIRAK